MGERVLLQHLITTGALALALCLLLLGGAGSERAYALGEENYRPDQVIVKINTSETTIVEFNDRNDTSTLNDYFAGDGIYLLELPDSWTGTALEFANKLANENDPSVMIYAQPNFLAEAPEDPAGDARMKAHSIGTTSESTKGSRDRRAARNLGLSCAAEISQGKGSTVAVLDTGAQLKHPALQDNFETVKGDDFLGYDFLGDDTNASEPRLEGGLVGHGTHVAGIVARVAPAAKIMPLRVLNAKGVGDVFTIAKAVSYAQRHGVHVINLSLGSPNRSKALQEIIGKAIDKGVVVVAAAGNSNTEKPHYPAAGNEGVNPLSAPSVAGLLAVTSLDSSIDRDGKKSWFANYGTWVDIAAPGQSIRSAFPPDQYANWSGTSMATPFVSGQAALIRTVDDSLDPAGIKKRIRDSAREEIYSNNSLKYALKLGAGQTDVCESLKPPLEG